MTILSIVGVSAPAFWVAIILQIVFGLKLNILPISGFDSVASYILPSVALGARYAGSMARITRTSMLEVLNQDYIRTARAKGAKRWSVILKHALKNATIPIVTLVGTDFGYMLTGCMLIERYSQFRVSESWQLTLCQTAIFLFLRERLCILRSYS